MKPTCLHLQNWTGIAFYTFHDIVYEELVNLKYLFGPADTMQRIKTLIGLSFYSDGVRLGLGSCFFIRYVIYLLYITTESMGQQILKLYSYILTRAQNYNASLKLRTILVKY